jgi:hypothetical protein
MGLSFVLSDRKEKGQNTSDCCTQTFLKKRFVSLEETKSNLPE